MSHDSSFTISSGRKAEALLFLFVLHTSCCSKSLHNDAVLTLSPPFLSGSCTGMPRHELGNIQTNPYRCFNQSSGPNTGFLLVLSIFAFNYLLHTLNLINDCQLR